MLRFFSKRLTLHRRYFLKKSSLNALSALLSYEKSSFHSLLDLLFKVTLPQLPTGNE
jgi:hypothetical protein